MSARMSWSLFVLVCSAYQLAASTQYVGTCGTPNSPTISAAISAVPPNSTIRICPNSYFEQVIISKSLTLQGVSYHNSNAAMMGFPASPSLAMSALGGDTLLPMIWVTSGPVTIQDIFVNTRGSSCNTTPNLAEQTGSAA